MRLCIVFVGAMMLVHAADVSGRWVGTSEFVNRDGQVRSGPIILTLKQTGEALEGTAGPSEDRQHEIQSGKVIDNKVTFESKDAGGRVTVDLLADEGTLAGEAKFHREYGVITMKLKLKRQ